MQQPIYEEELKTAALIVGSLALVHTLMFDDILISASLNDFLYFPSTHTSSERTNIK